MTEHARQMGKQIRAHRKAHNMTLKDLGQMIGLSEQAISQYERGTRKVTNETLKKIYDAINGYESRDAEKVVLREVYDQMRWERDIAISQLEELGVGFGEEMPDMARVVRCKNCKHWGTGYGGETEHIKVCEYANYMVGKNGYCVYGERKTNDEQGNCSC